MVFPFAEAAAETPPAALAQPALSGAETILLVEDEAGLRKYLRQALERHGYKVIEAASGREAIDLARRNSGDVHLLLTDIVMPEMGGAELAAVFSHGPRAIPVLCMSGYSDRAWQPDCPAAGFIQKPFTIDALLSRIRQLLAAPPPAAGRPVGAATAGSEPRQ
jgi:CheY-like chemotaxis protein